LNWEYFGNVFALFIGILRYAILAIFTIFWPQELNLYKIIYPIVSDPSTKQQKRTGKHNIIKLAWFIRFSRQMDIFAHSFWNTSEL